MLSVVPTQTFRYRFQRTISYSLWNCCIRFFIYCLSNVK